MAEVTPPLLALHRALQDLASRAVSKNSLQHPSTATQEFDSDITGPTGGRAGRADQHGRQGATAQRPARYRGGQKKPRGWLWTGGATATVPLLWPRAKKRDREQQEVAQWPWGCDKMREVDVQWANLPVKSLVLHWGELEG